MIEYEVIVTDEAEADLRSVYEHIAFELYSPDNAAGQVKRLERHILDLNYFPEKYRPYQKEPWYGRGMRVMPVDNYVVLFIPNHATKSVTVNRVMYAGRDIDAHMEAYDCEWTHDEA